METFGIPGSVMHTDVDDDIQMILDGKTGKKIVKMDPNIYHNYIIMDNGNPAMYVNMNKALYGTF